MRWFDNVEVASGYFDEDAQLEELMWARGSNKQKFAVVDCSVIMSRAPVEQIDSKDFTSAKKFVVNKYLNIDGQILVCAKTHTVYPDIYQYRGIYLHVHLYI